MNVVVLGLVEYIIVAKHKDIKSFARKPMSIALPRLIEYIIVTKHKNRDRD